MIFMSPSRQAAVISLAGLTLLGNTAAGLWYSLHVRAGGVNCHLEVRLQAGEGQLQL